MALVYRDGQFARTLPMAPASVTRIEPAATHSFQAWTESLYITGVVRSEERLSDLLNRREPVRVIGGTVVPLGARSAAGRSERDFIIDPFDLDLVLSGPLPEPNRAANAGRRIHKIEYPILIAGSNFEARGTVHCFPGSAPDLVAQQPGPLFIALTRPVVRRERRFVSDAFTDVCLVNRYAVRRVRALDTLS